MPLSPIAVSVLTDQVFDITGPDGGPITAFDADGDAAPFHGPLTLVAGNPALAIVTDNLNGTFTVHPGGIEGDVSLTLSDTVIEQVYNVTYAAEKTEAVSFNAKVSDPRPV